MIAALLKEIDLQRNYLQNEPIETIYFGGGTPSLLEIVELRSLIELIHSTYTVSVGAEITLESNPDDINEEKLSEWKVMGINRLSLGIQSFFDDDLKWMNRAHNTSQAVSSLEMIKKYFDNVTVDLIYGSPSLTNERWKQNVEKVIALDIPHISCYALTVEPKTALDKMIANGKAQATDPEKQSEQFLLLMQWLTDAGYEHYEISNFAKPGYRSKHNSSYWQGKKYVGIGPSAHSFNGVERQWNIANNSIYISNLNKGIINAEKESLTLNQQLNEYIMTALRRMEGIDVQLVGEKFGAANQQTILTTAEKYIRTGKLLNKGNRTLQLTNEGKLLADGIASDLFIL